MSAAAAAAAGKNTSSPHYRVFGSARQASMDWLDRCMSFMYIHVLSSPSSSVFYTHIHMFSEYKTFSRIASLSGCVYMTAGLRFVFTRGGLESSTKNSTSGFPTTRINF